MQMALVKKNWFRRERVTYGKGPEYINERAIFIWRDRHGFIENDAAGDDRKRKSSD